MLASVLLAAGCSFVQFEKSPYTPRDVVAVYSAQEDLTFVSWKVGEEADVGATKFELYRDGAWHGIALGQAPYPAAPYACGDRDVCLQYQVEGRLSVPADHALLRAVHDHVWGGPDAQFMAVDKTFDVDPIGVDNNQAIDPVLFDWFHQHKVALRRDYQYQLVARPDACAEERDGHWHPMHTPSGLDHGWVDSPKCFAARPKRRDKSGPIIVRPLDPSAETSWKREVYAPPSEQAPVVYGVLFDLEIANATRCQHVRTQLLDTIAHAFEARGTAQLLDVYLPVSARTGEDIDDCHQQPGRYYPVDRMLHDAEVLAAQHDPQGVRVVWIYVNNSNLVPEQEVLSQLQGLQAPRQEQPNLAHFSWAIGSNSVISMLPWNATTGWRPIGDDTFRADIVSFAKNTLPFMTMKHDLQTEVSIAPPDGADASKYFKLCTSQPHYAAVGSAPGQPPTHTATSAAAPWPAQADTLPFFTIDLGTQRLVPFGDYVHRRVEFVVEVCQRFCNNPFRTRGGRTFAHWRSPATARPMETCQWSQ